MSELRKIQIRPGVVKDDSALGAKPRWTDSNRIRWVRGKPRKLGGWTQRGANVLSGICRGMDDWQDNSNKRRIAFGTHKKFYALEATTLLNLTPIEDSGQLTGPFDTTSGSLTVVVNDAAHGRAAGDTVNFQNASAVGGITPDGDYIVKRITASDKFDIEHSTPATSTVAGGGGTVDYEYELGIGRADAGFGAGYGLGPYGAGTYGTARTSALVLPPRTWSIDQWGEFLLALPREGNLYEWQLGPTARAALVANAPTNNVAMFVTDERHVVLLGADGTRMLVQWSDQDDNTNWTPSDITTAGTRLLTGGSTVLAGLRTDHGNLIWTDSSIWSMQFIGGQDVFGFEQEGAGASGIIGPHGAVEVNGVAYWMANNDFYLYDGVIRRIPKVDDIRLHVFENINPVQQSKVYTILNSLHNEIWWCYPTGQENDRYVKYNYAYREWDVGVLDRTAGIDKNLFANPVMVDPDGIIYDHESGLDDNGLPMGEYIVSAPFLLEDGDEMIDVHAFVPDFTKVQGVVDVEIITKEYPQSREELLEIGSFIDTTERMDMNVSGRQAQVKISGSTVGTFWQVGTLRFEIGAGGGQ